MRCDIAIRAHKNRATPKHMRKQKAAPLAEVEREKKSAQALS